ncbi:MAG: PDZ domain-containing protein [Planctomycetota bacterium]
MPSASDLYNGCRRLAFIMRIARVAALTTLSFVLSGFLPLFAQDALSQQASVQEPTAEQIEAWVKGLDDERFAVRETAERQLAGNLSLILPKLIEIAKADQTKSPCGLLQFLGFVAQDAWSQQGKLAYECLGHIAKERTTQRAILAQKMIQSISVSMREQALERLERVGVLCKDRELSVLTQVRPVKNALVIDEEFQGTQEDLEMLPWLFDIQFVKLEGPAITPEMLQTVVKLPQLRSLQIVETNLTSKDLRPLLVASDMDLLEILYSPVDDQCIEILQDVPIFGDLQLFGTELSAKGATELVARIETANVFVGRGGFLGITCEPSSLVIQQSIKDGPAYKAGIKMNDKLRKINGVPIYNFEDLRKQLAKSAAGESVVVEYYRPIWSLRPIDQDPENKNRNPVRGLRQQLDGYETHTIDVVLEKRPSKMEP